MRASLLRIIHTTLKRRAEKLSYYSFPDHLNSLEQTNPTQKDIDSDYSLIRSHFKHPVFADFVPTYYEMKTPELAWIKRYTSK